MRELTSTDFDLVAFRAKVAAKRCGLPWQELQSLGWMGLLRAAANYDGSFGVPFAAYAQQRIDGEIKDRLRCEYGTDQISRKKMKLRPTFTGTPLDGRAWHDTDLAPRLDVEEMLSVLPERWQRIMRKYHLESYTALEIAQMEDVCEGRIHQILRRSMTRIRECFGVKVTWEVDEPLLAL